MSNELTIKEIIEIGIEIEKNGAAFYNELKKSAKTSHVRDLFEYLAEEEEKHVVRFQEILDSVGGYQISEAYYYTEYMDYMKALADERVFKKDISVVEIANKVKTPRKGIDIAIGFEKESILLFHEMWHVVPESDKKAIQKLIDEERNHIRRLSAIKSQLSN